MGGRFQKGKSGNPGGRPRGAIADLSAEARKYGKIALDKLVELLQKGEERSQLAAAKEILDRGFGRPLAPVDVMMVGKKLSELSDAELEALTVRLAAVNIDAGQPADETEALH